tara:strand:+ start:388 stop:2334 length:1947 start_codon:yes stop_codon:yes gene_type:complete
MPGYNVVKTQRALPIGSVQPWTGDITSIPDGWLLCNNDELQGAEYPLLARVLRDTYGGDWNNNDIFPNYTGTFRLPPTNDKGLADISVQYFGISGNASYPTWAANTFYSTGDVVSSGGNIYSIAILDSNTISANGGTTAPTGASSLSSNSLIQYTQQTVSGNDVPNSIDSVEALSVVSAYIGDSSPQFEPGDLGPPNQQDARTDINMTYTPDPEGTADSITSEIGTMPTVTETVVYNILASDVQPGTNTISGAAVVGDGVSFTVVFNAVDGGTPTFDVIRQSKGFAYEIGDQVVIPGTLFSDLSGGASISITVTITAVGSSLFEGQITGQSVIPGFAIKEAYIVPRKLGRTHMPSHFHPGSYETINFNDASTNPGSGVTVFSNPSATATDFLQRDDPCWDLVGILEICANDEGNLECSNVNDNGATGWVLEDNDDSPNDSLQDAPFTAGVGRHALAAVAGGLPIKGNIPVRTDTGGHGVAVTTFIGTGEHENLRDGANNSTVGLSGAGATPYSGSKAQRLQQVRNDNKFFPGHTIPFSDQTTPVDFANYDEGTTEDPLSIFGPTDTLFDHNGVDFNVDVTSGDKTQIEPHDHDGEISIVYNGEDLEVLASINAKASPNVQPAQINDALQMRFITRVPSLSILNLIRAY